jgi:hypothetical protein
MRFKSGRAFGSLVLLALLGVIRGHQGFPMAQQAVPATQIFSSDPGHLWNRLHDCLFVRETADGTRYGADTLDPLLWDQTTHLLTGLSHNRAISCLDEFLQTHAERIERNILKRAILQHDLWAVFDWAARAQTRPDAQRELESRLAVAIRRLALTPGEILALPDTYAAAIGSRQFAPLYKSSKPQEAFLPTELFRPDGPWVCISAFLSEPTAIAHFTGRSRFLVFMQLPGGREPTMAYIRRLQASSTPPLLKEGALSVLNLTLPQFPAGTQVALVRQAIVIDSEGRLQPTRLTESIQLRVYHAVTPGSRYVNDFNSPSRQDQNFFEFRLSRPRLFAGRAGGLVAVDPGDVEYPTFSTHGEDSFESIGSVDLPSVILDRCRSCHSASGIHSIQSRLQWMKPSERKKHTNPIDAEYAATIARKQQESDFRLLQEYWRTSAK